MASKEHWEHLYEGKISSFTTGKQLYEQGMKYFQWCKDNPIEIEKKAMTGKEIGKVVIIRKVRPYTLIHLCLHLGISGEYLKDMCKLPDKSNEFYVAATALVNLVRGQNIEMAMVDEFNPIFASKMLGLEKDETPSGAITVRIEQSTGPALATSETLLLEKIKEENEEREKSKEK